ncbi:hypothetical protein NDU88_003356 [Pleurodeles waltl]|uniref:Uncharacterized protein n=1 Tax=Pleurodeles waltl TaxID=8319 RepID=A0AAV7T5J9_PLEWA|nr:hypothetical protein NDU88_003356 [Pleurodeles waltl]
MTAAPNLGPARTHEYKLKGEELHGPVDSQAWSPQGTAGWKKGVPSRARGLPGLGPSGNGRLEERSAHPRARSELSEHIHAWESSSDPVLGVLPLGGPDGKAQDRGSQPGAHQSL